MSSLGRTGAVIGGYQSFRVVLIRKGPWMWPASAAACALQGGPRRGAGRPAEAEYAAHAV